MAPALLISEEGWSRVRKRFEAIQPLLSATRGSKDVAKSPFRLRCESQQCWFSRTDCGGQSQQLREFTADEPHAH